MKKIYSVLVFSLLILAGCSRSCVVGVRGIARTKNPIPANAHILVTVEPNAANQIFESEVRTKIEKLLRDRGYQVVDDVAVADYRLTFQLGLSRYEETSYQPTGPHERGIGHYVPHVQTVWDQMLNIKLYHTDEVAWEGQAFISERYPEERKGVNCLLVAVFEFFGQDTGGRKYVTINVKDPRIAVLGAYAK